MDRWKETHTYTVPPNVPGSKSLTWWLSGDMFLTHRNELLCGLHVRKYLSLYVLYIYIFGLICIFIMKKFLCYAKSNVEKPMTSKIVF